MKRFLLVCGLFTMALATAFAQEIKKVAILEVVDREGKLSYSQKMVLRSNMARAVTNTSGFEAYDRSDLDAIMSEQDFQRTGMVSDAEIRKLGEMTGVSLILVTEGVVMGNDKLFVSAKILNVETGRVEMMDNITIGTSAGEMQSGCNALTGRLFSVNTNNSLKSTKENKMGGIYLNQSKPASMSYMLSDCFIAYSTYNSGVKLVKAGWACTGVGLGFAAAGLSIFILDLMDSSNHEAKLAIADGCFFGGLGVAICSGVPLLTIGYKKKKEAIDIYNNGCVSTQSQKLSLNLITDQNGLGLAVQF